MDNSSKKINSKIDSLDKWDEPPDVDATLVKKIDDQTKQIQQRLETEIQPVAEWIKNIDQMTTRVDQMLSSVGKQEGDLFQGDVADKKIQPSGELKISQNFQRLSKKILDKQAQFEIIAATAQAEVSKLETYLQTDTPDRDDPDHQH